MKDSPLQGASKRTCRWSKYPTQSLSHSICHAKCLKQLKPIHSQCVQQPISSPHRIKVPRPTFAALAAIHLRHCRLRCKFWQLWHLQIFTQSSVSDKHSVIFIDYSYIIPWFLQFLHLWHGACTQEILHQHLTTSPQLFVSLP